MNKLIDVLIITLLSGAFLLLIASIYLVFKVSFIEIGVEPDKKDDCIDTYTLEVLDSKNLNSLDNRCFMKETRKF